MSKKIRYILIFLVLALIIAVAAWLYVFKDSESNVASEKTDVKIAAPALLQAFETDEKSADLKYTDKIILVSGIIESISKDSSGYNVYLKEPNSISGVLCRFDISSFDSSHVKTGAQVSIKGRCNGYVLDVQLNKCLIAE